MTTALIGTFDKNNKLVQARALLDTCATANFITIRLAEKLQLPKTKCCITIGAVNNLSTTVNSMITITFRSLYNEFKRTLTFLVVPNISDSVPYDSIPREKLKIPNNIRLADPNFHKPAPVDMLIGAGTTLSLFCIGTINLSQYNHDLILQKTKLGWVLGGGLNFSKNRDVRADCMMTDLDSKIERFWLIEEVTTEKHLSKEECECEAHFKKFITRDKDGRYIVALPFKKSPELLGQSRRMAMKQLEHLTSKFSRDAKLKEQYATAIQKFLDLEHMSIAISPDGTGYYLPHHAVIKSSSSTTKIRIVFNGSAKTSTGYSLNDLLMAGPIIQDTLFSLILRFRTYVYVLMADIEKMFLQFLVREEDRKYLKILWRIKNDIVTHNLNTVTFGLKTAPFLAIRCLQQLAEDDGHLYPLAAKILTKDLYVDNLITGTNSKQEARLIYEQMTKLLSRAQLNMRQWVSNDETILDGVDEKSLDNAFMMNRDSVLKALGIYWKAKQDCFIYTIKLDMPKKVTKRSVLSEIAKLFDPLGLIGPVILYAKRIMQELWKLKITWDESVPLTIYSDWQIFCKQLKSLNNVSFPRKALIDEAKFVQLHGFSDASQTGYGACIYLTSNDGNKNYYCTLLCAKSRVAPLKNHTIPRLELSGALLLAELYQSVISSISIKIDSTVFWTDSEIVLHWLNTEPNLLKTFVANRVAQIQAKTKIDYWRHVRTLDNPADKLSRGQLPNKFINNDIWFKGPSWLSKPESNWPKSNFKLKRGTLPETKRVTCLKLTMKFNLFQLYSDFSKLKRTIARWVRLSKGLQNSKEKGLQITDVLSICKNLTLKELDNAEIILVKLVQRITFHHEIQLLNKGKGLDKESRILRLDPFVDKTGLLRVGGRLGNATLPFNQKHPIILPKSHVVTDMIISYYHRIYCHTGVQMTLYTLRRKYWLIDGRNEIRKMIKRCVTCFRARPKLAEYQMGNLPEVRTNLTRAFLNVGVDYCGPFYIKERKYRAQTKIKAYVAVFICMSSKAIHIEVVRDLSTDAFLAALRRFVARRGNPQRIYADNATNFQGAKNELNELYALAKTDKFRITISNYTNKQGIEWHFIPPSSPHFGGLWEAGVKSYKHHFKRVAYNHLLTFEELYTLSLEIEAILNSRPLTPIPTDVNDLSALTPGHFLIGDSLIALPEPDFLPLPSNRLSAWQLITKLKQDFWKRWSNEYLNELNIRQKWNIKTSNPELGMIVVIKEDNVPTMQWPLGRIVQLHKGKDGVVRAVTLKTANNNELKRPVKKIAVLPI